MWKLFCFVSFIFWKYRIREIVRFLEGCVVIWVLFVEDVCGEKNFDCFIRVYMFLRKEVYLCLLLYRVLYSCVFVYLFVECISEMLFFWLNCYFGNVFIIFELGSRF